MHNFVIHRSSSITPRLIQEIKTALLFADKSLPILCTLVKQILGLEVERCEWVVGRQSEIPIRIC